MPPSPARVATRHLSANAKLVAKFRELEDFYKDVVQMNDLPLVSDRALANALNGKTIPLGHEFLMRLSSHRSPEVMRADHMEAAKTLMGRAGQFFGVPSMRDAWARRLSAKDVGFSFSAIGGELTVTVEPR